MSSEKFERFLAALETHWGEGILVRLNAPSRIEDKAFLKWFGQLERAVASPNSILALMRANYEIDVSYLLPSIGVPTLIFHREGDALVPVEAGRLLARNIPGAKYVELPGDDHLLQAMDKDVLDILLDQLEDSRARDASIGRYLATSIKTGNFCAYDPGPVPPVSWRL